MLVDYTDGIVSVTTLKKNSARLVRMAKESGQPIVITQNGKATAVLQDVESFQRLRDALLLLKFVAKGDQELRAGRGVEHDVVASRLGKRHRSQNRA
ncbi:MAG: type II toxin-antitoxin system Phd/YefM family antitoxin [Acidobacteria bacterium]|nr:type II toxin-antitoxin system Phd/YefM family antitoxin [Acidobacteriota bacterium]